MTETAEKIIESAIATFVRYGAKKTTMADIAEAAEVSRQTVYALFGDKDGIIVAAIRYVTDKHLAAVRSRIADASTLSERLDIYFAETVTKSFELLQNSSDAEDLISGHNRAGREEIKRSHERHRALIAELLEPYAEPIGETGQSYIELSDFVVTAAMALKSGASNRQQFDSLIRSLKNSILSLTCVDVGARTSV